MGPNFFGGMKLDSIDWGWEVMQLTPLCKLCRVSVQSFWSLEFLVK